MPYIPQNRHEMQAEQGGGLIMGYGSCMIVHLMGPNENQKEISYDTIPTLVCGDYTIIAWECMVDLRCTITKQLHSWPHSV